MAHLTPGCSFLNNSAMESSFNLGSLVEPVIDVRGGSLTRRFGTIAASAEGAKIAVATSVVAGALAIILFVISWSTQVTAKNGVAVPPGPCGLRFVGTHH